MPAGPLARSLSRKIVILAALPVLGYATYWCGRLAWADHLSRAADPAIVARAVRLSPGDAGYRLRLADAQQNTGADPAAALAAARTLEPGNANTWIRLGLAAEVRGDLRVAERDLLQAARASRLFGPRWALANYYFRRGDASQFWQWARESLLISYGGRSGVFQLCWHMRQDAGIILKRAIPERRDVLNAYLLFLLRENRQAASEPVAIKLAALATPEDQSTMVFWCNRQLDAGAVAATVEVWNTLCTRHVLPYAPLDRDRAPLTDGDFAVQPLNSGFAWRLPAVPGVSWGISRSSRHFWFTFSGDQPEICTPLLQFVPVTPGAAYRFRFGYRTSRIPPASGLRWSVSDGLTGADLASDSPWLGSPDWKREEVNFTAPSGGLARLSVTCQRLPGSTRIEGSLELRGLSVERRP